MEDFISISITLIFVFAVLHFVYESIIVPSERMMIRDELFEVRDNLRSAYGSFVKKDQDAFDILHNNGINHCLNNLSAYNMLTQLKILIAIEKNPELKEMAEKRIATIKASDNEVIVESFDSFNRLVEKAHLLNAGGWFFYVLPIAILVVFTERFKRLVLDSSFMNNGGLKRRSGDAVTV